MPFAEGTPTVEITLGGKSYTLGWTWAAKRRARDYFASQGKDPDKATQEENIAVALWASLEKEARDSLSVGDIEEVINPANEEAILEKMSSLFTKSEPDPKPEPVAAKIPTTGRSTSMSSPQLASTT